MFCFNRKKIEKEYLVLGNFIKNDYLCDTNGCLYTRILKLIKHFILKHFNNFRI